MIKLKMKNYNHILTEKQEKYFKKQLSVLSSGKIGKYECLTGKEILLSNQRRIIEKAKFADSPVGKAFKKQTKTTEEQGRKQTDAIKIKTKD